MAIENLFSTEEAADQLGITESLVRRYCRRGEIGVKIGNQWVISADEIRLFGKVKRRRGRPRPSGNGTSDKAEKS